jgi:hypothetical protein
VPLNVAVPFAEVKVIPLGKVPVKLKVDFGCVLLVVMVKVLAVPTTKVALFTLVMRGGRVIERVKFCVAAGRTPLDAVNVTA